MDEINVPENCWRCYLNHITSMPPSMTTFSIFLANDPLTLLCTSSFFRTIKLVPCLETALNMTLILHGVSCLPCNISKWLCELQTANCLVARHLLLAFAFSCPGPATNQCNPRFFTPRPVSIGNLIGTKYELLQQRAHGLRQAAQNILFY